MFRISYELGSLGTYVSGAGPTIIAVVHKDDDEFFTRARAALEKSEALRHFTLYRLLADNAGAKAES